MTSPDPLLQPLLAMVGLIFLVLTVTFLTRLRAVRSRTVRYSYFRLMQSSGQEVPPAVVQTARNFVNQFEVPILFFIACLVVMMLQASDGIYLALAWTFVVSRVAHAAVHITYNNVTHRLAAFAVGVLALAVMWLRIALAVILSNAKDLT